MSEPIFVNIRVNGVEQKKYVEPRIHLIDFLRDSLEMKTSRVCCEHGVCGACTVRLDGEIVRGCLVLAVQANGHDVETIDGASDRGDLTALQAAFHAHNALQCGYCTPGMLLTASALLTEKPEATRSDVREYISGNYCRCTGYHAIVDAICEVLEQRRLVVAESK
ncbi:MAG: (2Fe-2S)-binding protein [Herbaspirillum sp.]